MNLPEEIQYLKDQIRINQFRYARCVQEKDCIAMDYLAQKNRDLIDQLSRIENARSANENYSRKIENPFR